MRIFKFTAATVIFLAFATSVAGDSRNGLICTGSFERCCSKDRCIGCCGGGDCQWLPFRLSASTNIAVFHSCRSPNSSLLRRFVFDYTQYKSVKLLSRASKVDMHAFQTPMTGVHYGIGMDDTDVCKIHVSISTLNFPIHQLQTLSQVISGDVL
jgi:hypothetical protein